MLRRKREVFAPTDGVLSVMSETGDRANRGIDFSGTDGLASRFGLAYRQSRLRTEDMELAEADGVQVTRKVVTRRAPGVDAGTTCAIGGRAYDVTRVDLAAKTMTLWLSELTTDGTCVLHATSVTRDGRGEMTQETVPTEVYVRTARMGGERGSSGGAQSVWPTVLLTLRACDWRGERSVTYRGVTYKVESTRGDGAWVELTCAEGAVQHGQ